jgi:hypothetical protein
MSMPKGYRSETGYSTVVKSGGRSYKEIAEEMTSIGFKMKHSAARNILIEAMKKFAVNVCELYDMDGSDIDRIAADPRFQDCIASYLEEESMI